MSDAPIPLYDGEPSGAKIIHVDTGEQGRVDTETMRGKRGFARHTPKGINICLTVEHKSGKVEHVECPVVNMSATGIAVEFDQRLETGVTGCVAYRTISHQPVRVSCRVQRCQGLDSGRFLLALTLYRALSVEERRPAKPRPGRELAPGLRPRKLREPLLQQDGDSSGEPESHPEASLRS